MTKRDKNFIPNAGLEHAIDLLRHPPSKQDELPNSFADHGSGELATLHLLAPQVPGSAAYLDSSHALAHMNPLYALDHMKDQYRACGHNTYWHKKMNMLIMVPQNLHNISDFFNQPTIGVQDNQQGVSSIIQPLNCHTYTDIKSGKNPTANRQSIFY